MNSLKIIASLLAVFALAGCAEGPEETSPSETTRQINQEPPLTSEDMASRGYKKTSYSASGKTYVVYFKRDPIARADKVLTFVSRGTPFTATSADDVEVQNMLRDAYRALGMCTKGRSPGLINFGYGPFMAGDTATWSAYVRCSKKVQANV
jgi:hypothetical protein